MDMKSNYQNQNRITKIYGIKLVFGRIKWKIKLKENYYEN